MFYKNFTTDIINKSVVFRSNRTLNGIISLLSNQNAGDLSQDAIKSIWKSIIFYNYIPCCIQNPGRPSTAQWRSGLIPFRKILEQYGPDGVLVCGLQLWGWLVWDVSGGTADPRASQVHTVDGVPCAMIRHPSRFAWREWRKSVEVLLAPRAVASV